MTDNFSFRDFGIGVAAGWASAYIVYQMRGALARMRDDTVTRVQSAQRFAGVSAEGRYVAELVREAERSHLAGEKVALSKIAVPPRFVPPPPFAAPPEDDIDQDVFRVVPRVHDLPWLYQPYNIPVATIDDLGRAGGAYALLGMPGSGRTSALYLMALYALGVVSFDPPDDVIAQRLRAEEDNLSQKERLEQQRIRMSFEQRAYDRLREMNDEKAREMGSQVGLVSPYKRMLPIYVHLSDVHPARMGGRIADPAEPLVRALQQQIHPRTAKLLPRRLYPRLENGGALVLLDGFDAQSAARQSELAGWLTAFVQMYGGNGIVVAGDVRGSGLLTRAGLTPVYLRPWSDQDTAQAAQKWAAAWPEINHSGRGRPSGKPLAPEALQEVVADARGLTVSEIVLRLWAAARGSTGRLPGAWAGEYLKALNLNADLTALAVRAAALEQDEALITPARLTELTLGMPAGSAPSGDDDQETPSLKTGDVRAAQRLSRQYGAQLSELFKRGLLIEAGVGYQFRHSIVRQYLAALSLSEASDTEVMARSTQPAWEETMPYVAGMRAVDGAAQARLDALPDVRYSHLTGLARWAAFMEAKPAWRATLLRQLGNLMVAPAQFTALRERFAAALVATRDPDARKIFERALRAPEAATRRVAALGSGALRDADALTPLNNLRRDVDPEVQLASVLALGALGTDEGYEAVAVALLEGTELIRQAASETLADLPTVGYETLYDALRQDDIDLRRAAVFGLGRVHTPWSAIEIYRTFLDDSQWYVRSAAQTVITDLQEGALASKLRRYPALDSIDWLREWVSGFGARMSEINPEDALMEMLSASDKAMQPLAAQVMGQLGLMHRVSALYGALKDPEPTVRDSAQRALLDLEVQSGIKLPAPA
jgi:HEAT repeat protein